MKGYTEFEFDLPRALLARLIEVLDDLQPDGLIAPNAATLPEAQGVYQLFLAGKLVYIGKTDAEAGLRTRLLRHTGKTLHRPQLVGLVSFKAVRIMVFTAMELESQLIKHYKATDASVASWNGGGFGSNDPGRERETTNKDPDGFDASFPISIDLPIQLSIAQGSTTVWDVLKALRSQLPYTFRIETLRNAKGRALPHQPHPDLLQPFAFPTGHCTVRQVLKSAVGILGSSWQATLFPSHVILYKESRSYNFGTAI